jgi:hypothetical protein
MTVYQGNIGETILAESRAGVNERNRDLVPINYSAET